MKILTRLAIQAAGLTIQANGYRMQNKRALSFMRKDVSFSKKEDAEYVRNCMRNLIKEKGKATLKDLYELCGETSKEEDENSDFQRDGSVYLAEKYFQRTWTDWMQRPPIPRPNGWWKSNVDPRLKGWTRVKEKFLLLLWMKVPATIVQKKKLSIKSNSQRGKKALSVLTKRKNDTFVKNV